MLFYSQMRPIHQANAETDTVLISREQSGPSLSCQDSPCHEASEYALPLSWQYQETVCARAQEKMTRKLLSDLSCRRTDFWKAQVLRRQELLNLILSLRVSWVKRKESIQALIQERLLWPPNKPVVHDLS